jgi:hypothetical protein
MKSINAYSTFHDLSLVNTIASGRIITDVVTPVKQTLAVAVVVAVAVAETAPACRTTKLTLRMQELPDIVWESPKIIPISTALLLDQRWFSV